MEWFEANWLTIVSVIISLIAGIVITHYYYRKGKKERIPCYDIDSFPLVTSWQPLVPYIQIHYPGHGESIPQLSCAVFIFWNAGSETIRKADVPKNDPLTIVIKEGCVILNASILKAVNPVNNFSIGRNREKRRATLSFDFIDHSEWVIVLILHTGATADDLQLSGSVIGAKKPLRKDYAKTMPNTPNVRASLKSTFFLVAIALTGMAFDLPLTGRVSSASAMILGIAFSIWTKNFQDWVTRKWRLRHFPLNQK